MNERGLLLTRRGLVFLSSDGAAPESLVRALALEFASLGYLPSERLMRRFATATVDELVAFRAWALGVLREHSGLGPSHTPLFRRFPEGVPEDTGALWWRKVLVHYLQAEGTACLTCGQVGTTHVLQPCTHVVCSHCWDGANYSACPVCEHAVDRASPFFLPSPDRPVPTERVTFKRLELGEDLDVEVRSLFEALCARRQALSPDDLSALTLIVAGRRDQVLRWLPESIPVRENVAAIFGMLARDLNPSEAFGAARPYLRTATDVLRVLAVMAGTDGSLQPRPKEEPPKLDPWAFRRPAPRRLVRRLPPVRLDRAARRTVLGLLDALPGALLAEDMMRHRSAWKGMAECLHPHEYAERFPVVAAVFRSVRGRDPDGKKAPVVRNWASRLEAAVRARDVVEACRILDERPGELARRFDWVLRSAPSAREEERVLALFLTHVDAMSTPVLCTLRAHLAQRARKAPARVFFPKGASTTGVSAPDSRAVLRAPVIREAVAAATRVLLGRFAAQPAMDTVIIDRELEGVPVPFNERTASRGVAIPRGARFGLPEGKLARLCMHWCEPQTNGSTTDLDLSVGLYDETWSLVATCSYYELRAERDGKLLAQSAGDLRSAPFPNGATEYVDIHLAAAREAGVRYAVMLVTNFHGMPMGKLERAFAGVMLRDDPFGTHYDPRTMQLKFDLSGENGVVVPLVFDVQQNSVHWIDVQQKGGAAFNNLHRSDKQIRKLGTELPPYFASGARPSMYALALLHAAARARRVLVRSGQQVHEWVRRPDESVGAFHSRLVDGQWDERQSRLPGVEAPPVLAVLCRGDIELPPGSAVYALFREGLVPTLSAADLLS